MARQILKRDKHEITWSNIGQDAGTAMINVTIAQGVQMNAKNAATECVIGSHIKSIYLEFHFSAAQTGNINVIHWEVQHVRPSQTVSNANTYYQTDRASILKRGMEMLPTSVSTIFKRIILVKVPRHLQRVQEGAIIRLKYQASSTQTINACGFGIYKEIY